jgi:hypothetical protein
MGEITLPQRIALLLELLHRGCHIDGVPHHDRVGDQIEAAGLMGPVLRLVAGKPAFHVVVNRKTALGGATHRATGEGQPRPGPGEQDQPLDLDDRRESPPAPTPQRAPPYSQRPPAHSRRWSGPPPSPKPPGRCRGAVGLPGASGVVRLLQRTVRPVIGQALAVRKAVRGTPEGVLPFGFVGRESNRRRRRPLFFSLVVSYFLGQRTLTPPRRHNARDA